MLEVREGAVKELPALCLDFRSLLKPFSVILRSSCSYTWIHIQSQTKGYQLYTMFDRYNLYYAMTFCLLLNAGPYK